MIASRARNSFKFTIPLAVLISTHKPVALISISPNFKAYTAIDMLHGHSAAQLSTTRQALRSSEKEHAVVLATHAKETEEKEACGVGQGTLGKCCKGQSMLVVFGVPLAVKYGTEVRMAGMDGTAARTDGRTTQFLQALASVANPECDSS